PSDLPNFRYPTDPNQHHCDSVPSLRGALRNVINAARDAVEAGGAKDESADLRTATSCGSDAPTLASSLREEAQMTVANKPGHRGEREVSRKTIARGMPGRFRCDRGDYARVLFLFCMRGCGRIKRPAFPAPSVSLGRTNLAK